MASISIAEIVRDNANGSDLAAMKEGAERWNTTINRAQLELPINQQLEGHELIAQLIQSELFFRTNERAAYYLKLAKLRLPAIQVD